MTTLPPFVLPLPKLDDATAKRHARLKDIRTRTDLALNPNPWLRTEFRHLGQTVPLRIRYYQVQGILHLCAMDRFVLGDDTGIGKTIQGIAALCYAWRASSSRRAIILTTKSATTQWADEVAKFTTGVQTVICAGTPVQRQKARDAWSAIPEGTPAILIMGYRTAVVDFTHLQDLSGYSIIFDEATAFKTPKTHVHNVCKHLARRDRAVRAWGLTATLIKNNLIEGYGIYKVIVPELFTSEAAFVDTFCKTRPIQVGRRFVHKIVGYRDGMIPYFRQIIDPFFLGRPKFEVASELPVLAMREHLFSLAPHERSKYREAIKGLMDVGTISGRHEEKQVTKLTAVTFCQQIVNHLALVDCEGDSTKLAELITLLSEGDLAEDKVIVFSRFKKMIDIIEKALAKVGIVATRVTGDENVAQRKAAMDAFQDPESAVRVILLTMAGNDAINLQAAKAIVLYDTPWSAGDFLQILGRMIRIGSRHDRVYAIHMVAENTIDQTVMGVMKDKMGTVEAVIGKRIKGEADDDVGQVSIENDISVLFASLMDAAKEAP